ncbi:ShET2/EspL2 family type III secretion system effector toxin [Dyella sp. M7H15-1]|uniref:ShET2/EspL2 family type III secretion system effector toxin n=1 Tax=Dyella sp. M7H15-1 TaxID=2501295 RepID=UPI001004FEBE|nr:ShET2/EspL2 family type III secretion system effector toxin [Dyella sp. M7H15-1]QAU22615.1 ShET2/EspL2 family type III secretion system effector toxin [Dyella sp. M7H15-1]
MLKNIDFASMRFSVSHEEANALNNTPESTVLERDGRQFKVSVVTEVQGDTVKKGITVKQLGDRWALFKSAVHDFFDVVTGTITERRCIAAFAADQIKADQIKYENAGPPDQATTPRTRGPSGVPGLTYLLKLIRKKMAPDKSVPYLPKKHKHSPPTNLNGEAPLHASTGKPQKTALCRNLSVQFAYDAMHTKAGKVDLKKYSSVDGITQHVSTHGTDADWIKMKLYAQEGHLVDADEFGKLLSEQFKKIEHGSGNGTKVRALLVESTNHSMATRMLVKRPADKNVYVVSFYEPNSTDRSVRSEECKEGDKLAKLEGRTLRGYIEWDGQHDSFYQDIFGDDNCAMVYVCSDQTTGQPPLQTSQGRALTSRCEKLSPTVIWHLLAENFSVDLANLSKDRDFAQLDVATQSTLLAAKDKDGVPGLFVALRMGHTEAIKAYGKLLKLLPKEDQAPFFAELRKAKSPSGRSCEQTAMKHSSDDKAKVAYSELCATFT